MICALADIHSAGWDARLYGRFASERLQPVYELLKMVGRLPGLRVLDCGCGTGEATALLHRELQAASTLGIDNSPSMLEQAWPRAGDGLEFREGDFTELAAEAEYDLVFSNAALHWAEDQPAVLARWYGALKPGGQLAVQLPANQPHVTQVVARELARREPYATAIAGRIAQPGALEAERYAEILHGLGATGIHVRLQVFLHELQDTLAAADWVQGSLLTGYRRLLVDDLYASFECDYRGLLLERAGQHAPYLLAYRRILMHAVKPG